MSRYGVCGLSPARRGELVEEPAGRPAEDDRPAVAQAAFWRHLQ